MEGRKVRELKQFIEECKSNPSILHNPTLSFFKSYLLSLGAQVPPLPKPEPVYFDDNIPLTDYSTKEEDDIMESDIELDNTDVVEPDNDPPQTMANPNPSAEVTEDERDAAQVAKSRAMDAISEGKLDQALGHLTEAILLNPHSAILYATRASAFLKLKKPNAAIRDADYALKINPDSAKGFKMRGMARAMLGLWEEAVIDLRVASKIDYDEEIGLALKKVEPNAGKIEEHRRKYERLRKQKEQKGAEPKKEQQAEAQMVRTKNSGRIPPAPEDTPQPAPPARVYQHAPLRREKAKKNVASSSSQQAPTSPPPPPPPAEQHMAANEDDDDLQAEFEEEIPDSQDTSLLASYPEHVACAIWQGKERGLLGRGCNRNWKMPLVEDLPEQIREIVQASGLAPLVGLSYKNIDKRLLSSFVERWYKDTNTFHLPMGEMTVTLDDVSALLHIPVRGRLIPWSKPAAHEAVKLMKALLGVSDNWAWGETQKTRGGAVRFIMLEELFDKLVRKKKFIEAARCYLLCLIGSTLFLDKSMTYIGCQYLSALEDVHNIQHYGWGACALAHLYAELTAASKRTTKQLGGYGTLLEAWIKEHFPYIGSVIPKVDYEEHMPRASKWDHFLASGNMEVQYRSHLESLRIDQVAWQPYDPVHRQHWVFEEASLYRGHLRCGDIRRAYLPDRVLRQFGYVQSIPIAPPRALPDYLDIDNAYQMWTEHVLDDATRGRLVRMPGECTRGYLDWVHQTSHPYLLPKSERVQHDHTTQFVQEALSALKDGKVIGTHSAGECENKLNSASKTSRLAILYFTATWCGPCRFISHLYTSLAEKYPKLVFLKVDIDEAVDIAARWKISSVPSFFFIKNGKEVDNLVGADNGALERKIKQHA